MNLKTAVGTLDLTQSFDPQRFPRLGQYHPADAVTSARQALKIRALRQLQHSNCRF